MEETVFLSVKRGNDLVIINKNARYQLGLIHINEGCYTIDGDNRKFKHVNNALETLIKLASTVS